MRGNSGVVGRLKGVRIRNTHALVSLERLSRRVIEQELDIGAKGFWKSLYPLMLLALSRGEGARRFTFDICERVASGKGKVGRRRDWSGVVSVKGRSSIQRLHLSAVGVAVPDVVRRLFENRGST